MPLDLRTTGDAESRAEQRLIVLQQLTAALARTRTYDAIASVIIEEALPALHASVGVVALASEDRRSLRNVGFKGVDEATESAWQTYPVESPVPVAECALRGEPIIVRTLAERNERYPVLAEVHGLEHGGPVVAFPLVVDTRLLGVLAFCWGGPLDLDADDLSFLATLAEQCGLAIERARLYDLARTELEVRKASEEKLREANARKDEFLAMLAHELRNPLSPIRSAADLLSMLKAGDARLARIQEILTRQTEHMKRIVDDLLDVSRIARRRVVLELGDVDLVELVRTTVADHALSFDAAGIELGVRVPDEPVWTRADVTRLSQALANLLHNAQKFTPAGKRVSVSLERDAERVAVINVEDEGAGIDPDLLPRVFEPFAQGEKSLARTAGGLGLGLALVRGLVELHGGNVTAVSAGAGKGTTFRIRLPLEDRAAPPAPRSSTTLARERKRVLVVEDNEDAAEMLALLVDRLGHEVRIARRADEALAILEEWSASLILSDLGLPEIDGFDFARRVRARRDDAPPFLVAVSGYGSESDKRRARAAGFDEHLTKPVDLTMLEQVLAPAVRP